MGKVTIQNDKGVQKQISDASWHLMKSKTEDGNIRKGWRLVTGASEPERKAVSAGAASKGTKPPFTFVPPELEEQVHKQQEEANKGMISGTAAEEGTADADAQGEQAGQEKADNLGIIDGIGPKAVEALNAAGIHTFAQLAAATPPTINAALDKANMAAKKAQVPNWKMKAKELTKQPAAVAQ